MYLLIFCNFTQGKLIIILPFRVTIDLQEDVALETDFGDLDCGLHIASISGILITIPVFIFGEVQIMQERRKYPRKDLLLFANVYDSKSGKIVGTLLNITLEGAMVLSENRIDANNTMELHIKLPENFVEKNELVFVANTRWCGPDINPEFFDVGYQFANVSEEDGQIIQTIIEKYGFKD